MYSLIGHGLGQGGLRVKVQGFQVLIVYWFILKLFVGPLQVQLSRKEQQDTRASLRGLKDEEDEEELCNDVVMKKPAARVTKRAAAADKAATHEAPSQPKPRGRPKKNAEPQHPTPAESPTKKTKAEVDENKAPKAKASKDKDNNTASKAEASKDGDKSTASKAKANKDGDKSTAPKAKAKSNAKATAKAVAKNKATPPDAELNTPPAKRAKLDADKECRRTENLCLETTAKTRVWPQVLGSCEASLRDACAKQSLITINIGGVLRAKSG